jgi:hypothetical protein
VRVPTRSHEDGPFDDGAMQLVGECCISFVDAAFHGAGDAWDKLIATSGEVSRKRDESKPRRQ